MLLADYAQAPFFAVRATPDGPVARGQAACFLGHQLPSPGRERPDGIFAEWAWDGARLLARTDRYGFQPLFYYVREGEVGLSPSVPKLLLEGAPTELDDDAFAVFLRLGFFLGEDTPFRAVRALPPGATLEWRHGALRVAGELFLSRPAEIGRTAAIEGYVELFRRAVHRRLPPDNEFAVPLSGGRDSRHILLELCAAGRPPKLCATVRHHPPRIDQDAEVAAQVAAAVGVPHVILEQRASRFEAELRKNLRTGFGSDEGTHFLPLRDDLAGRVTAIWDGMGSDVLSAGLFLDAERLALFRSGRLAALADRLLNTEARVEGLLVFEPARRFSRERALARLEQELRRHVEAPNPVGSFFFWNRTRREIALMPAFMFAPEIVKLCPYLDHDLYDFLAALPAELLLDHSLHTEAIRAAYPAYADLPYEAPDKLFRFDRRQRVELGRLIWDVIRYLHAEPSRLLYAPHVEMRLLQCYIRGFEPRHFTDHVVYVLQLERLVRP